MTSDHETVGLRPLPPAYDVLAAAAAAIGAVACAGWILGLPPLVRWHASLLPMQADTALGFVFAGLSLHALGRGRRRLAITLAAILAVYATLGVIEFSLRANFGVHMWHTGGRLAVTGIASTPMARATAVLFAWFGAVIVCAGLLRRRPERTFVIGVGGAAMLSAAAVGVGARGFGFVPEAQWMREASHMAWQTMAGMALLAAALVAGSFTRWRGRRVRASLPAAQIAVMAIACSAFFWQVTIADDRKQAEREMGVHADAIERRLIDRVTAHTEALARMAGRLEFAGHFDPPAFNDNSTAYLRHAPDLLALGYADADGVIRQVAPLTGFANAIGFRMTSEPVRAAAIASARFERRPVISGPVTLRNGRPGFVAFHQVGVAGRQGFVLAAFELERLLDVTAGREAETAVVVDGRVFAATHHSVSDVGWSTSRTLSFAAEPWRLRVSFGPRRSRRRCSRGWC